MPVRALWYGHHTLSLIDQRALPARLTVLRLRRVNEVADSIRTMVVRGAPAIGVAAAYGMALASREPGQTPARAAKVLRSTRPTAVDLFVGIEAVRSAWARGEDPEKAADAYRQDVVEECRQIGLAGAPLLPRGARILTHCNAGALATVQWGTALAPIRVASERGRRPFVYVDETRPLLQGARLTAWELAREGIAYTVIADNAAGYFLKRGDVDVVIVGADRIARNGDFANKIGTYEKAVVARENGIPFYVAAPWTTFDFARRSGDAIPVEERSPEEVLSIDGVRLAPRGSSAANPAFDVTPARYVTGFITPAGVVAPRSVARLERSSTATRPTPTRPVRRTR